MAMTWILVANASKAKIFAVNKMKFINGKEKLSLIKEFTHPESRKRDLEIASDKLGNFQHGSFVEPTDPKKYEAETFAREVVEDLETGRVGNLYEELILVVPPSFHGLVNKNLRAPLQKVITHVVEKDYTKDDEKSLEEHLRQQLG